MHDPITFAKRVLEEQVRRVWEELSEGRLKVEGKIAAGSVAGFFKSLQQLDESEFCLKRTHIADSSYDRLVRSRMEHPCKLH